MDQEHVAEAGPRVRLVQLGRLLGDVPARGDLLFDSSGRDRRDGEVAPPLHVEGPGEPLPAVSGVRLLIRRHLK